jgi:hypothetical protein
MQFYEYSELTLIYSYKEASARNVNKFYSSFHYIQFLYFNYEFTLTQY